MNDEKNKPRFTPGPWSARSASDHPASDDFDIPRCATIITAPDTDGMNDGMDWIITQVLGGLPYGSRQKEANAHLIAAAPKMYDKLVKLRDWMYRLADQHEKMAESYKGRFDHLADECRADAKNFRATAKDIEKTLAKARGKQP